MPSTRTSPRIVSLAPSATSILCSIGAKKSLLGVSKWCPTVALVSHLPKFGDCWHINNVAAIQALKPDLVIGSVPFRAEALTKLLSRPLNFLALNPKSLADIDRDILQLGALTNRTAAAHKLIHTMHRKFENISRRARKQLRLRVYSEAWPNPRISSPPWVAELIAIAGGTMSVTSGSRVSDAEVAAADPEVILLAWAATGSKSKTNKIYSVRMWQNVSALRSRRVFVVQDDLLNTPGPPLVQGATEIARILTLCRNGASAP
jgi:ABC-type Fe3+-hydroxamate transport system substrate-binding protein